MSMPNQSAIVILVPQAKALVQLVRLHCGLEMPRVPAHITVLFPFKPPDEITRMVEAELQRLFVGFRPFPFSLSRLGTFPDTLYLSPTPTEPFVELTRAVHRRFPETPPYDGAFDEIVPHLTLARSSEDWPVERMVQEVEAALRSQLPIQAMATEIKLLDNSCGEWCERSTFALKEEAQ